MANDNLPNPVALGKITPGGAATSMMANIGGASSSSDRFAHRMICRLVLTAPAANAGSIYFGYSDVSGTVHVAEILKGTQMELFDPAGRNIFELDKFFVFGTGTDYVVGYAQYGG